MGSVTVLERRSSEVDCPGGTSESSHPSGRPGARLWIDVSPRWCATRLGAVAGLLVALHVWIYVVHYRLVTVSWGLRCLFDLDEEQGFGTWFSSLLLLAVGVVAFGCARAAAAGGGRRTLWTWIGPAFVLLSIDEVAGFHELFNTLTDTSWAVPASALVGALALSAVPLALRLPRRTAASLALAASVYFGGAIGVELVTVTVFHRLDHLPYALCVGLEEGLEMVGALAFLVTGLDHLATLQHDVREERA